MFDVLMPNDIVDAMQGFGAPSKIGKVRVIYKLPEKRLLVVSSDQLSAFDWLQSPEIPGKGMVLNQLAADAFRYTSQVTRVPNHFITDDMGEFPPELQQYTKILAGRSMIVKELTPIKIEAVFRIRLAGQAWREYQQHRTVFGLKMPLGLHEGDLLPYIMFTPTSKAESGHDIPMTVDVARQEFGPDLINQIMHYGFMLFVAGATRAQACGLFLLDTKYEFGVDEFGRIYLIDEVHTPDSSRFMVMDSFVPGQSPEYLDKEFLRRWLREKSGWDTESDPSDEKAEGPPTLPPEVVAATSAVYLRAYQMLMGHPLPQAA